MNEELQEQARLLGMSAEREMALRARIDRQEKALRQALEALVRADRISGYPNNKDTITVIREALAEGEQK